MHACRSTLEDPIVASGRSSVEEQFLTRKLAQAVNATVYTVSRIGPSDGILVSADRNPNIRGALVTGLISALPVSNDQEFPDWKTPAKGAPKPTVVGGLNALGKDINAGKIKVVLSIGEDLVAAGLTAAQVNKVSLIHMGTHANAYTELAKMIIPTFTPLEKSGTFVNQQFRLQKFGAAVPGPKGAYDDLVMLSQLIASVGGGSFPSEVHGLWPIIAAEVKALAGLSYANLPATGHQLDGSPWAALPFAETETLHYKPANPPVAAATK